MNFYFVARWRRGEPRAADDAASAEWVPLRGRAAARRATPGSTCARCCATRAAGRRGERALAARGLALLAAALAAAPPRAAVPDSAARAALQRQIGHLGRVRLVGPAGETFLLRPVVRDDGLHMRDSLAGAARRRCS